MVVPEITVVFPCNDNAGLTGTVVGPLKISYVVPPMTVMCPGRAGTEVAEGMTRNGIPDIKIVLPVRPAGAPATGIVVGPGIRRNGVPPMVTVLPRPGGSPAAGTVVELGMTKTGVPPIEVIVPRLAGRG